MSKIEESKVTCVYCGRDFLNADLASALSDIETLRAHAARQDAVIDAARMALSKINITQFERNEILTALFSLDTEQK